MSKLTIMQLYPQDMNIYGDWGNVLTLLKRAAWRGIDCELIEHNPGDSFDATADVVLAGGAQDSGQDRVAPDLHRNAQALRDMAAGGVPMLAICGMYQLFGNEFVTKDGHTIEGIGVFDMSTRGTDTRLIGNTVLESKRFGTVLGYENHSGQTYLGPGVTPLGRVRLGAGNNAEDKVEGAVVQNVIGTYLHGSLLPKNPRIADFLLEEALRRKDPEYVLADLEVPYENEARQSAMSRPR